MLRLRNIFEDFKLFDVFNDFLFMGFNENVRISFVLLLAMWLCSRI